MDDKERIWRALIGVVLGFIIGCGFSYLSYLLLNWSAPWIGKESVEIIFRRLIPMGIFMGLAMGVTMYTNSFGD